MNPQGRQVLCIKLFNEMGAEVTILDTDTAHRVPSRSDRASAPKQSRQSAKGQGSENERGWKILVKERKNVILHHQTRSTSTSTSPVQCFSRLFKCSKHGSSYRG